MGASEKQKLYCYLDETGQDAAAQVFVVVAVVSGEDQDSIREVLTKIERESGTGHKKWRKVRPEPRLTYLDGILKGPVAPGQVFYGCFEKPIPYFFPMIEVLERGIKAMGISEYSARVTVDGIDRKKATELTNALRARGVSLKLVKSMRDESEALLRLADMWAGCIRAALDGSKEEKSLLDRAHALGRVTRVT